MQQEDEFRDDTSLMKSALPAYQEAVDSGDTAKTKFLASFIEDHFGVLWTHHREALLQLSLPALSSILSSDRLNIQAEPTVWLVIENWTHARRAERLEHLPLLIKQCLRIGRLRLLFIDYMLSCSIYVDMSAEAKEEVKQHVDQACGLLSGARSFEALIDGRGLLYHKSMVQFCPRKTRHLLIAAGGLTGNTRRITNRNFTSQIEVYDGQLELWRPIHLRTPYAGHLLALHYLDGFLYLFGDSPVSSDQTLHALDLTQTTEPIWSERCKMLQPRDENASVLLDGHLYVLGGYPNGRCCDRYNLALDRWEAIAPLHYGRCYASAAIFRGRIYIAGGYSSDTVNFTTLASVEVYSPQSNSWQLVASMTEPRFGFSLVPYGDRLWAITSKMYERRIHCESYDSEANTWRQEGNLLANRDYPGAIAFNGQLVIAGGQDAVKCLQSTQIYDPKFGWIQGAPLSQGRSFVSLLSVPNMYPILRP